ncbi:MAG: Cell division protein ftsA [Candidatus Amesbacteria bacterium GW2011_GWB1_47_19]|nr:MAG: Cell division protein ftsA [Candidatus Amesbacteria bacterium GW2011_GWA1_44_24]KKU30942.1 MAG: cell division protein FtsA, cell division protein FtsA [Candidatus Amesbacteria bacterium GW2011_GWC1_46_24]KKU66605.1 MAG: Cell division protein ftsA [Candidatus Amesbacteria bacterium GW2011_GWB1_47_19]OGD05325.1 MAG: cell division protein FtsA [Candidatus Amesbacteria bacterium RIFOXYB1_FULL_47_13]HBC73220.1 cell division protein FtsA [Candidatus Amesbacteria bacterium]
MAKSKVVSSIDVGSSKIAALVAQLSPDETQKIHVVGAAAALSRGVRKGQIVNIDEVVSAITEAVESAERMAGYNIAKSYVTVGGTHIGSQNSHGVVAVSQPQGEISSEDVRRVLDAARAVSLPASHEIIHVLPRQFTVDSQEGVKDPVGMTGVRLEVDTHIVTGSSPVIRNLTKCIGEVGCDVSGLVFSGLASGAAVLTETEKELGVILVDIGGGTMSLAIYVEGALSYSSVLPVGAINVTKDLAAGLRISLESAEKLKLFLGNLKNKDDEVDITSLRLPEELKTVSYKTLVEGIIRPRLNEMFQQIAVEIRKSNLAGLTPSGLVLTGGGALTVGIVDSAKRILATPVKIGFPTGLSGLVDDIENPAFAAAVGLLKLSKSAGEEAAFSRSTHIPGLPKFDKFPAKGIFDKIVSWTKSLLP